MVGTGGRAHLVFNGEILNYRELRHELSYPFRTNGDSEVLLALYEKYGAAGSTGCAVNSHMPCTTQRPARPTSSATASASCRSTTS